MHGREQVGAARGEHSSDFFQDADRIVDEDKRVTMPDDVEGVVLEDGEILHVAANQPDLDALSGREVTDGLQLGRGDVEDGRLRAELGKDDGIPTTSRRQAEDAGAVQLYAFQTATRVHEAAHPCPRLGRSAEGAGGVPRGPRPAPPPFTTGTGGGRRAEVPPAGSPSTTRGAGSPGPAEPACGASCRPALPTRPPQPAATTGARRRSKTWCAPRVSRTRSSGRPSSSAKAMS